jgi:hypothetical protein
MAEMAQHGSSVLLHLHASECVLATLQTESHVHVVIFASYQPDPVVQPVVVAESP